MGTSDEDLQTLPKATISKLIKEYLSSDVRCANDARDLIADACAEFVQMIASEANDICTTETKKTISPEHVIAALKNLGYLDYVKEVEEVYDAHKLENMRQQKQSKKNQPQISEEELKKNQQMIFAKARAAHTPVHVAPHSPFPGASPIALSSPNFPPNAQFVNMPQQQLSPASVMQQKLPSVLPMQASPQLVDAAAAAAAIAQQQHK